MRHPKRIVVHSVGRYADRARFAEPPKAEKGFRASPLPVTHPDYTPPTGLKFADCSKSEQSVALKRNRGWAWEKIAQETGYTLIAVKRMHRSVQTKAIRSNMPLRTRAQPGHVYFLRSDDHIKIGYATDVAARIRELQCGNPTTLALIGAIPAKPADERALHRRFNTDRVQGEWFRRSDKLLAFIEAEKPKWTTYT